jgi:5-formyltetrahydrofolate cyclo-ligase
MAFSSFGSEVETAPILERLSSRGARVILPRVEGSDIEAVAFHPGDPVRRARYGALEPSGGAVVPRDEIDVVIVPGLAFEHRGYRVGYGGGFYDRFLRRLRPDAVAIGVGFSAQIVEEVPHDSDDKPVDMVVTEQGIVGPNDRTASVGRA